MTNETTVSVRSLARQFHNLGLTGNNWVQSPAFNLICICRKWKAIAGTDP